MSRRRRVGLLVAAAAVAAGLGVSLVSGYSASVSESYGPLQPVLVVTRLLDGGETLTPGLIREKTDLRQVPSRFVPAGAISSPARALGLETTAPLAAGSYLTSSALRLPRSGKPDRLRIGRGRVPVELSVSGAGILSGAGPAAVAAKTVDVLVTREGPIGNRGKTRVAAERVPLIAVLGNDPADDGLGPGRVVLGLTRPQAIALIDAESFARRVTVIQREGR